MELAVEKLGDVSVIAIPGESLDAGNAKVFRRAITPLLADNTRFVFDMSSLRFVDSSGLVAILSCLRQLRGAQGDIKLCGMARPVRAIFELVRMHRVFEIHDTREAAAEAFGAS